MVLLRRRGRGPRGHQEAQLADFLTPDLCVIGGGSGGLAVAEAARRYGASVVIVERDRLGGSALHAGTVPSRALAAAAAGAQAIRDAGAFGIAAEAGKVNFRKVHDHVEQVVAALAPAHSPSHLEALGAEIVKGEARFVDKRTLAAGDVQIRARRFVIATGARTSIPRITGLESIPYFTAETILDNTRKLTHLVVIGSTGSALELAQAYCRLGTEVTLVADGQLLPGSDPELVAVAMKRLAEEGVAIRINSSVTAIQARSMGIGIIVRSGDGEDLLDASHVLVANGRLPNLSGLDLDKAGIRPSKSDPARLQLSDGLVTTNPRVYAVGDAVGGAFSAASARHQAGLVVRHVLLGQPISFGARPVPSVVYTDPAIAEVGLGEAAARTRYGLGFRVTRIGFAENDLAHARRETYGLAKLITHRSGRILGAGVAGAGAGELIGLFSLAIAKGMTIRDLSGFVAASPTFAEIATRLGAEASKPAAQSPLLQRWIALVRLLG